MPGFIEPETISKDKHAIAGFHPHLTSPLYMHIHLDILECEPFGEKLGQILAILPRKEPPFRGELIFKTVANRQYKRISSVITVIKRLHFKIMTEGNNDYILSNVKIVLHFKN